MTSLRWLLVALLSLSLMGCGRKEPEKVAEGENVSTNPLGALRQLSKAGEDLQKAQKEIEDMKPVEPLHFSELLKYLPEPPSGWQATKPKGSTNKMGEWSFTQVERQYTQGDKHFEIEIADWAFNKSLYASFFMTSAFSQEDTEGYNKGVRIANEPGREEYKNADRNGTLSLLVGKRFFVTIKGQNIDAAELRQWWDRFDAKGLRSRAG